MKKVTIYIIILAIVVPCLLTPALAVQFSDTRCLENEYNKYTITFSNFATYEENFITQMLCVDEETVDTYACFKQLAERNIAEAKNFVLSLGLENTAYEFIQDSCLDQLSHFESEDILLESYSVLTPNTSVAASPVVYGTYQGVTFYSQVFSEYSAKVLIKNTQAANISELTNWTSGLVNLFMSIAGINVPLYFQAAAVAAGMPKGYTAQPGDSATYAIRLGNVYSRGIYVYQGGLYKLLYSGETGTARSVVTYYPANLNLNSYALNSSEYTVSTQGYNNPQTTMNNAWHQLTYGGLGVWKDTLESMPVSYYWK